MTIKIINGGYVLPGNYKLAFSCEGSSDSTLLNVKPDPRMHITKEDMEENYHLVQPVLKKMAVLAEAIDRIREREKVMKQVKSMVPKPKTEAVKSLMKTSKVTEDSIKAINADLFPPKNIQGLYNNPCKEPQKFWAPFFISGNI